MASTYEFHPAFVSTDGDIILRSADDVCFKVHSLVLRNTCGFFRDMFTLPQDSEDSQSLEAIDMSEESPTLTRFLTTVCCMEQSHWISHLEVEEALFVAEKYQAPGALSVLRPLLSTPLFHSHPLHLYHLAAHFDWEREVQLASTLTLTLDIHDQAHEEVLRMIPSAYLIRLYNLHNVRKTSFRILLSNPEGYFVQWQHPLNSFVCPSTTCRKRENMPDVAANWKSIQWQASNVIDKRPLGDTIHDAIAFDDMAKYWKVACSRCATPMLTKETFLTQIRVLLGQLPQTV